MTLHKHFNTCPKYFKLRNHVKTKKNVHVIENVKKSDSGMARRVFAKSYLGLLSFPCLAARCLSFVL